MPSWPTGVETNTAVVRTLHAVAEQLVDALPVFTD